MYERFAKKIHAIETVAVFMHINPDGDCVGSALAMYGFLKNLGKQVDVFMEEGHCYSDGLSFFPYLEVINASERKQYDLGIAVDCGSASRLGSGCYKRFMRCDQHFCIDHHQSGELFTLPEDTILEPKAASTTQILFKIFRETAPEAIDTAVATLLFAGLVTDSGALTFSSATPETYRVAAALCETGIDRYDIIRRLTKDTAKKIFMLSAKVLERTEFYADDRIGLIYFSEELFRLTGTAQKDTEGIINRVIDVIPVCLALSVVEAAPGTFKIGIRSKNGVNSAAFAGLFGGGGHVAASGCRLYGTYEEVHDRLIAAAIEFLNR